MKMMATKIAIAMDTDAAMGWNSLPNEVKCAINTNCFKKTIKNTPLQLLKMYIL